MCKKMLQVAMTLVPLRHRAADEDEARKKKREREPVDDVSRKRMKLLKPQPKEGTAVAVSMSTFC